MFNKGVLDKVLGGVLAGTLMLAVAGHLYLVDSMNFTKFLGFLLGLLGGFLSVFVGLLRTRVHNKQRLLTIAFLSLSPLGFLALLPFSPAMGGGYLVGASITFSFSWAIAVFLRNQHGEKKNESGVRS